MVINVDRLRLSISHLRDWFSVQQCQYKPPCLLPLMFLHFMLLQSKSNQYYFNNKYCSIYTRFAVITKCLARIYETEKYVSDTRIRHLPLMGSPFPTFFLILMYYYFVNNYGPKLMKNRGPFNMYYPMMIYNSLQIVINGWFVYKVSILTI